MEKYLIDIKDLNINDQNNKYNFLSEMYPSISSLYQKLWFYENIASIKSEVKDQKIIELKNYILQLLEAYNIPESVMLVKIKDGLYVEPISKISFKLDKHLKAKLVSEDYADVYIDLNKKNSFFSNDIPMFKELTKTKYKKR